MLGRASPTICEVQFDVLHENIALKSASRDTFYKNLFYGGHTFAALPFSIENNLILALKLQRKQW